MKLKELRKSKNITQLDVATAIGVSPQVLSRYERGEREPDYKTLCKLADFFEVSVDELLGRTPQLFDDARVDRPEIMELYELMTPHQQAILINYARGMLAASAPEEAAAPFKRRA